MYTKLLYKINNKIDNVYPIFDFIFNNSNDLYKSVLEFIFNFYSNYGLKPSYGIIYEKFKHDQYYTSLPGFISQQVLKVCLRSFILNYSNEDYRYVEPGCTSSELTHVPMYPSGLTFSGNNVSIKVSKKIKNIFNIDTISLDIKFKFGILNIKEVRFIKVKNIYYLEIIKIKNKINVYLLKDRSMGIILEDSNFITCCDNYMYNSIILDNKSLLSSIHRYNNKISRYKIIYKNQCIDLFKTKSYNIAKTKIDNKILDYMIKSSKWVTLYCMSFQIKNIYINIEKYNNIKFETFIKALKRNCYMYGINFNITFYDDILNDSIPIPVEYNGLHMNRIVLAGFKLLKKISGEHPKCDRVKGAAANPLRIRV